MERRFGSFESLSNARDRIAPSRYGMKKRLNCVSPHGPTAQGSPEDVEGGMFLTTFPSGLGLSAGKTQRVAKSKNGADARASREPTRASIPWTRTPIRRPSHAVTSRAVRKPVNMKFAQFTGPAARCQEGTDRPPASIRAPAGCGGEGCWKDPLLPAGPVEIRTS